LPSDVQYNSPRVEAYEEEDAEAPRQLSVDLLEEERDLAAQRSTIYQQNLRRYHSRRVRKHSFKEGDLVLHLKQQKSHKLSPPWEGPFVISKALLNGSYYLVDIRELDKQPSKKCLSSSRMNNKGGKRLRKNQGKKLCNRHLYMINEIKHLVHS
jgi:hypothetical protein